MQRLVEVLDSVVLVLQVEELCMSQLESTAAEAVAFMKVTEFIVSEVQGVQAP